MTQLILHEKKHSLPCDHTGDCNIIHNNLPKENVYTCDKCEQTFENKDELRQHMDNHKSASQNEQTATPNTSSQSEILAFLNFQNKINIKSMTLSMSTTNSPRP